MIFTQEYRDSILHKRQVNHCNRSLVPTGENLVGVPCLYYYERKDHKLCFDPFKASVLDYKTGNWISGVESKEFEEWCDLIEKGQTTFQLIWETV